MDKKILVDKGDQKLYDNYDKGFTKKLEDRLDLLDVSEYLKGFTPNSISILEKRYFRNDEDGNIIEDVNGLFKRVASNIAYVDIAYGANKEQAYKTVEDFYKIMVSMDFMPNSPTLMNAGRDLQQLAGCFVLPIEDSMESILGTIMDTGMVHKTGGGTGFSFGRLRMANDLVSKTKGFSSGPVKFLGAYDGITEAIKQGGTRRGANMSIMEIDHPDIIEFIKAKTMEGKYSNFNLSVALTDDFIKAVKNNDWYTLRNPKKGKVKNVLKEDIERIMNAMERGKINKEDLNFYINEKGKIIEKNAGLSARFNEKKELQVKAKEVFDYVVDSAWKLGEPGVIFIDKINKYNPTPKLGKIEATNPCGEQPLLPYEACNLGSINLSNFIDIDSREFDKKRLEDVVRKSVHFLDNVIDISKFPSEKILEMVHKNRKIGLGVMGWADALIKLKIPYDSDKAISLAEEIMRLINNTAKDESGKIAEKRGVFPAYFGSIYDGKHLMRNATVTTIAPTGTISKIAGETSSGIEPIFDVIYTHTDADKTIRKTISPTLKKDLENQDLDKKTIEDVIKELESGKNLKEIKGVPKEILRVYRIANDISIDYHIKTQAAFQKHVDNAVSKTVNFDNSATREDVKKAYMLAYKLGCKGVTIYRDGSREDQVLSGSKSGKKLEEIIFVDVEIGSNAIKEGDDVAYYGIKKGGETFHFEIVGDFWEDVKNKKIYILPSKMFQNKKPLGEEESTEFAQSGLDRTRNIKSLDPDYAEMIREWKSVRGDKEGMGPNRINSPSHGIGLAFEHYCLKRGIVKYNGEDKELINSINKKDLIKIKDKERKKELKKKLKPSNNETEHRIYDNIMEKFKCPDCGETKFHKESGCSDPICNNCGWLKGTCG